MLFDNLSSLLTYYSKRNANSKLVQTFPPASPDITYTRIGDSSLHIPGGAYCIPDEIEGEFHHHYFQHVFKENKLEYLTEKQLSSESPILIDLDFKYDVSVTSKQHSQDNIFDLIFLAFLEKRKLIVDFDESQEFNIYVMEKPSVNQVIEKGYTKDGVHIIIGIKLQHSLQLILRQMVLEIIPTLVNLPLVNEWSNVLDESISKGGTNWQLYGSRKPDHDAYQLLYGYKVSFDPTDKTFISDEIIFSPESFTFETFLSINARNKKNASFPVKAGYSTADSIRSHSKLAGYTAIPYLKPAQTLSTATHQSILKIEMLTNQQNLDAAIEAMLKTLNLSTEYHVQEAHYFAMTLPPRYYDPGSHQMNRKLAFALKNTDFRLFLTWIKVRSQAEDFDYSQVPKLYNCWCTYFNNGDHEFHGLTKKSIMYWSRDESPEKYQKVRRNTIDYFVDISLKSGTDYDFAKTIYHMFKNEYVCAQLISSKPTWYHFENHRWVKDRGNSLRQNISGCLFELFEKKLKYYMNQMAQVQDQIHAGSLQKGCEQEEYLLNIQKSAAKNIKKLKQCSDKNNIYRETAEIFFDGDFLRKMDKNKYLICFSNGVVDFKTKTFRNGYPDDYITKCTNIAFIPFEEAVRTAEFDAIYKFMGELFPIQNMMEYMIDHLSACMVGENVNQTFTIYRGKGSNGKSLLTDFMALTFGEYAGTVPVTLVTDKRGSVGGTQSEIMQLKGVRYAVMQEPSKDAKINEGMMKQLTGDSQMQARELYCESETFTIQFDLVVCLNELFKINSNDNGTWRRIRVVDFLSRFYDPNDHGYNAIDVEKKTTDDVKMNFIKDPTLKDRLPCWAPTFASILVNRYFEKNGRVEACQEIIDATDRYRRDQDGVREFYTQQVLPDENSNVKISDLKNRFDHFIKTNQYYRGTHAKELIEFLKTYYEVGKDEVKGIKLIAAEAAM